MSLFRLSDVLYKEGDYRGAESAARESVQVFERALTTPKANPYFANPVMELGLILNKTGRSRRAEPYLRDALEIRTRLLPSGNQLIGTSEGALGECLTTQKKYAEAEPLLLDSYKLTRATAGEHDPRTIEAVERLITLYQFRGQAKKAAEYWALIPQTTRARR